MPELWFLRHGQATHNVAEQKEGESAYYNPIYTDSELTDEGWAQARCAKLPSQLFSAIYCSPLRRCRQTLTATGAQGPVCLDDRLMEPQGTHLCNRRIAREDIVRIIPPTWDATGVAEENPFGTEQEAPHHFLARVREATSDIIARHTDDQRILIVAHHEWIKYWFSEHLGINVSPRNAEVLRAMWPMTG